MLIEAVRGKLISSMHRGDFLYFFSAATFVVILIIAGAFLFRTAQPTADVVSQSVHDHPLISVTQFQRGVPMSMVLNGQPIVLWWRDADQMALAKQQDDPVLWRVPESFVSGQSQPLPAQDVNLTINGEWFVAWTVNPTGFGCVVMIEAGDFGGFFDPCRGDHFDLSGRIRKGIARQNLKVISAQFASDGQALRLNLSNPPKVKR